jgi:acyl transferase domain-containing protein
MLSPNADMQSSANRAEYAAAGISAFSVTDYLKRHGTGTLAGDLVEVSAVGIVFTPSRAASKPLVIGLVMINANRVWPAAGGDGTLKAVMAVKTGIIPGIPTFIDPNPKSKFFLSSRRS